MMFNVPLSLHYKTVYPKQKNTTITNGGTALGAGTLGVNFIAGQVIEAERKLIMNIGPVSATRMLEFLPGTCAAKAIDVLSGKTIPTVSPGNLPASRNESNRACIFCLKAAFWAKT